jgi:murein DD-endopeptidase MepM/ murein hydrolase activator NlpD
MPDPTPRFSKRATRTLWVALAAVVFSLSGLVATEAARPTKKQRIQALRQRLKSLSHQKAEKREQLKEMKRAQGRLSDQLNESYERLEKANEALKLSAERLRKAEVAVQEATERLQRAKARLLDQQESFATRLAAYYKEGPVSYAEVLLGAQDVSDFLDRQYYVSRVVSADADLVSELREAKDEVARQQKRLLAYQAELTAAHEENADRVAQVASQASAREELLKTIERERALQEQRLAELEEDSNEIQHSLEQELARRRANPGRYRNLPRWSGSFSMPARGPVTSGFGYRYHPVLKYRRLHTGLDIGAGYGSAVYAAAAGEVIFASWRGGYGQCIIVLHGGGVATLYAHLSRIHVRAGQTVRRGQKIGAVGSTGLSTGPHLHFEVRRNGVPVNPR